MRLLIQFSNSISRDISAQIKERGNKERAGKDIKHYLCSFRQTVQTIEPLEIIEYRNNYFNDIVDRMEGNHMSFEIPCVDVLEAIIQDVEYHPLFCYKKVIDGCLDRLINILRDTTKKSIQKLLCSRFPVLSETLTIASEQYLQTSQNS